MGNGCLWERCCCWGAVSASQKGKFVLVGSPDKEEICSITSGLEEELEEVVEWEEKFFDCHSEPFFTTASKIMTEEDDVPELQEILSRLSEEELEIAARTSYDYAQSIQPSRLERNHHAKAMACRYFKSKKTAERALPCMKKTILFRQSQQIDALRTAFDHDNLQKDSFSQLEQMLASRKNFVMGYDKDGRSTFHFIPRNTQQHDLEWTLKESLYTMERAIACSRQGMVNAVIDFGGFDVWLHSPPLEVGQQFLTLLRCHYVGHFHKIFLVDVPLSFSLLWKVFEKFVGTSTRNKIVVLSNAAQKQQALGEWYTLEEAAPWMLEGGKKTRELDLQEYLYKTPFDRAFDE